MDNLYRFGSVEVVCEGYDYADDPYILKGSCGLEYTLELTKEGQNKNQGMMILIPLDGQWIYEIYLICLQRAVIFYFYLFIIYFCRWR